VAAPAPPASTEGTAAIAAKLSSRCRPSKRRRARREVVSPSLLRSSTQYFAALGRAGTNSNVLIDVFAGGVSSSSFGMTVYQALSNEGGGYSLCYTNLGLDHPRVREHVGYVLGRTWA